MKLNNKLFIFQYLLAWNMYNRFGIGKALIGNQVRQALKNEFPFIASIVQMKKEINPQTDTICTASLLNRYYVLSAAHCMQQDIPFGAVCIIGSIDLMNKSKAHINFWVTYNQWAERFNVSNGYRSNDICVLRLLKKASKKLVFATLAYIEYRDLFGEKVKLVGWGIINNGTYPRMLQTVEIKVISKTDCSHRCFALTGKVFKVDDNVVCTAQNPYALLLTGDSGGPLVYNNKVIGVNMGTFPNVEFRPDKINIHINLYFYKRFLESFINVT